MQSFKLGTHAGLPITEQIVQSVVMAIEKGDLEKNEQLMSINIFSKQHRIARDTVEKAYTRLKATGYITSVKGKGYYSLGRENKKIKVLFIFDKLSFYKKMIYDAFVKTLGYTNPTDVFIYYNSAKLLQEKLEGDTGKYHYYVIMPHFLDEVNEKEQLKVLSMVPHNQLILLDKNIPQFTDLKGAVYQDLEFDVYKAFNSSAHLFKKYEGINLIFPEDNNHPTETCDGIKRFCVENELDFVIKNHLTDPLISNQVYIVLAESHLALLLKKIKHTGLAMGKDIGVISFNEAVFKELLEIAVVTGDFEKMGKIAAEIIINNKTERIKNPLKLIERKSL